MDLIKTDFRKDLAEYYAFPQAQFRRTNSNLLKNLKYKQ